MLMRPNGGENTARRRIFERGSFNESFQAVSYRHVFKKKQKKTRLRVKLTQQTNYLPSTANSSV